MNIKTAVAAMSVLASTGALADFNLNLDLSGKPMRDLSKTTSKAIVGYISAMHAYGTCKYISPDFLRTRCLPGYPY